MVDIPKAAWSASMEGVFKSVPLVSSFKVQTDDTGAHLIVQLKDKAKVVTTARLVRPRIKGIVCILIWLSSNKFHLIGVMPREHL